MQLKINSIDKGNNNTNDLYIKMYVVLGIIYGLTNFHSVNIK